MKKRKCFSFALLSLLFIGLSSAFAVQPPNDNPCSAKHLGNLPIPGLCGAPTFPLVEIGDNTFATPGVKQPALLNCMGQAGLDMPPQSKDLWYSFVATANTLHSNLKSYGNGTAIQKYVIALYEYRGNCTVIVPVECDKTVAPLYKLSTFFKGIVAGKRYYLQVSGKDLNDVGEFSLELNNYNDCNECMQSSELFMNPPPVQGYYNPGQLVTFKYVVRGYQNILNPNNLHGIVPKMGPGWGAPGSIGFPNGSPPASGVGEWNFYTNYLDNGNNPHDGFFYDNVTGEGNPHNNLGDIGNTTSTWEFSWIDTVSTACGIGGVPQDLSIYIEHFSDFQTGNNAQGNASCNNDPDYSFKATLNCQIPACIPPTISVVNEDCANFCSGSISVIALAGDSVTIYDEIGGIVLNVLAPFPQPAKLLNACLGNYTIRTITSTGCVYGHFVRVGGDDFDFAVLQTSRACVPNANNNALVISAPQLVQASYLWDNGETTNPAVNLTPGPHFVTVTNTLSGCKHKSHFDIIGIDSLDATFSYPVKMICRKDTNGIFPDFIADQSGYYTIVQQPAGGNLNLQLLNGVLKSNNQTVVGTYIIRHTVNNNCGASLYDFAVEVVDIYDATFFYDADYICKSVGTTKIPTVNDSLNTHNFSSTLGLVIDVTTGEIDGYASTVGAYVVRHIVGTDLCADTAFFTINVLPAPASPPAYDIAYCFKDSILNLSVPNLNGETTAWFNSIVDIINGNYVLLADNYDVLPFLNATYGNFIPAGVYSFYAVKINIFGCYSGYSTYNITINANPSVNAGADQTVCKGFKVDLIGSSSDPAVTYLWQPGKLVNDSTAKQTIATIESSTEFILKVTDLNGCVAYDTIKINTETNGCDSVKLYNGFTPNGDGKNDFWEIDGIKNFDTNSVHIFNRWGTVVWEAANYDNEKVVWKGESKSTNTQLPDGTYYYLINTTKNNNTNSKKGWVEITR